MIYVAVLTIIFIILSFLVHSYGLDLNELTLQAKNVIGFSSI